ncbi:MAG: hypothetical protein WCY32_11565 [Burkholderiaceae bacterium]
MLRPLAYWARRQPWLGGVLRRLLHRHPALIRVATWLLYGRPVAAPVGRAGAPMADIGLDGEPGALAIDELLSRVRAEVAAQVRAGSAAAAQAGATRAAATPAGGSGAGEGGQ